MITPAAASSRDMDSSDYDSDTSSSDESDVEADVSDEPVYNKLKTEDAGNCMDNKIKRMDQLVADLTAKWDLNERESVIQCQAGVSMDRNAELVNRANHDLEEGHSDLSGRKRNPGLINKLPLECIVHIMHFIPIQQVFVCMSVNKKWKEAARHTVRIHKHVQLVSKERLRQHRIKIHNPLNLIVWNDQTRSLVKSLLLMEKLEQLKISDNLFKKENINPVIVKNAASLQVLVTDDYLPSSEQSPFIYPQLKELDCHFLSQGTECPVLEELTISPCSGLGPVDQLPILTMRKFVCRFNPYAEPANAGFLNRSYHYDDYEYEESANVWFTQQILQAAKRLVHLTHLIIELVGCDIPVYNVSTLMDNFTSLVHLELTLPQIDFEFDQKVDQLVRQNPGLRKLIFYHLTLSDAALTSIARLHDLQHLQLELGVRFTVNGVLTLLRSRLRSRLTFVNIEMTDGVPGEVLDEIDLIAAERGKALIRKEKYRDIFTFEIENEGA